MIINLKECKVLPIETKLANSFVKQYHYLHREIRAKYSFGLFYKDEIKGVIMFSIPHSASLRNMFGIEFKNEVIELSRLWIEDEMPKNSASYLISRAIKLVKEKLIVSFADPQYKHVGYVYQASNWVYTGQTSSKTEYMIKGAEHKHILSFIYGHRMKELKEFYGDLLYKVKRPGKHRYVYFNGNKHENKSFKTLISSLSYPK